MKHYSLIALLLLGMIFTGCRKEEHEPQTPGQEDPVQEQLESITLDVTALALTVGEEYTFTVTTEPADIEGLTLSWSSSDESIVSVEDGTVTAVAEGTADITVSGGDNVSATCKVTVSPEEEVEIEAESITLSTASADMLIGESLTLTATVLPENTTDKTVTWSSSESSIAGVDDNGTVTAVSAGTAVITATTVNGRTAECTVTVQAAPMIGDYFYSDGTWSTELDENKTPVGLVFYIGDITAEDAALATEYPGCTHGLVVSLNNTNADGTTWQNAYESYGATVNSWVESNSGYGSINDASLANGYNNTNAIEAFNADPANSGWPVEAVQEIVNFRGSHPVENTSDWYLPSAKEWMLLSAGQFEGDVMDVSSTANLDIINGLLGSISDAEKIEGMNMGPFSIPGSFWSSTEHSLEIELSYSSGGNITTDLYKSGALAKVRPILAF